MRTAYDADRFEMIDRRTETEHAEMKREVRRGLTARQKYLPCKYFYDSRGSALFEKICGLPEYYQTRTELSILEKAAGPVMKKLKEGTLIELGSGTNWKIRRLLDAADGSRRNIRYVPVDVCESTLVGAVEELLCLYPDLAVSAVVSDFHTALDAIGGNGDKLITFFGGTIGNFTPDQSTAFLRNIVSFMGKRDRMLVGMDLVKKKETLEAAYNDSQGITAQFNRNILAVMNRELNATFDLDAFEHTAFYDESSESVEMHLRARDDMEVDVAELDARYPIRRGETIFTEISRKFRRETARAMAAAAGLKIVRWYTDRRKWFALAEMEKA